jgi:hypothetical protein
MIENLASSALVFGRERENSLLDCSILSAGRWILGVTVRLTVAQEPSLIRSENALLAQEPRQQWPRSLRAPVDLHDFIAHVSFLIDSAPEIAFLTANGRSRPRRDTICHTAWALFASGDE